LFNEYYEAHPGIIRPDEDNPEKLFKMNEHLKHVNADITKYITLEHSMGDFVKAHLKLPEILESFKHIP